MSEGKGILTSVIEGMGDELVKAGTESVHAAHANGGKSPDAEANGKNPSVKAAASGAKPAGAEGSLDLAESEPLTQAGEKKNTAAEVEKRNIEIREENEKAKEKQKEIRAATEDVLGMVDKALKDPSLSEAERRHYEYVKKSVTEAEQRVEANKANAKDQYRIEAVDEKGNKIFRDEGMPVNEMLQFITSRQDKLEEGLREIKRLKRMHQESVDVRGAYKAYDPGNGDRNAEKLAWKKVFDQIPDGNGLKKEILNKVDEWETAEREFKQKEGVPFDKYNDSERSFQIGEATSVVVKDYSEREVKDPQKADQYRDHLAQLAKLETILKKNSVDYYAFHYGKTDYKHLTEEQKKKEKPFLNAEISRISKDKAYRDNLIQRYQGYEELPENFESLPPKDQNFELAKRSLTDRRILVVPQEKALETVPAEQPEPVRAAAVPATPAATATPRVETAPPQTVATPPTRPPLAAAAAVGGTRTPDLNPQPTTTAAPQENITPIVREPEPVVTPESVPVTTPEHTTIDVKGAIINADELVKRMAWTAAEERIRQEQEGRSKGGFFTRVKNKVANTFSKASQGAYYLEELNKIRQDNNLMQAINARAKGQPGYNAASANNRDHYYEILDSIVDLYVDKRNGGTVRSDAETMNFVEKEEMGERITESPEVKAQVADMLYRFYKNDWSGLDGFNGKNGREAVELYVAKHIAPLMGGNKWADGQTGGVRNAELYASNMFDIATKYNETVKAQAERVIREQGVENKEAILSHLQGMMNLDLRLAKRERDLLNDKPKGVLKLYEKMINWADGSKKGEHGRLRYVLGKIATNPFIVGAATSVGTIATSRAMKYGLVTGATAAGFAGLWIPLGAGALVGGAVKAWKHSRDIAYKHAEETRHETLGGKGGTLLDQKDGLRQNVMSFKDAISDITTMNGKSAAELTAADKQRLAEIWARLDTEKKTHTDLFKLEEHEGMRYGTTEVAKAKLKLAIDRVMKDSGLNKSDLENLLLAERQNLEHGIHEINDKFNSYKQKEMWKAFRNGALQGVVGGLVAQEIMYNGGRLLGVEYFKTHGTTLHHAWDWAKDKFSETHGSLQGTGSKMAGGVTALTEHFGGTGHATIDADYFKSHGYNIETFKQDLHHGLTGEDYEGTGHHAGRELMGHILHGKDGTTTMSFHKMLENIKENINEGNWHDDIPGEHPDPRFQHLIHDFAGDRTNDAEVADFAKNFHEHMKLVIYPTADMAHAHQGIELALDSQGNAVVPPEFLDSHGNFRDGVVFAGGYKDANGVFHILASDRGHGEAFSGTGETVRNEVKLPVAKPPVIDMHEERIYDPAIATVLSSKVKSPRLHEKGYAQEKKKLDDEKKRKEEAEKAKKKAAENHGGDHGGHGGHGAEPAHPAPAAPEHGPDHGHGGGDLKKEFDEHKKSEALFFDAHHMHELEHEYNHVPANIKTKHPVDMDAIHYLKKGEKDGWLSRGVDKEGKKYYTRHQYVTEAKKMAKAVGEYEAEKEKIKAEKEKKEKEIQDKLTKGEEHAKKIAELKSAEGKDEDLKKEKAAFKKDTGFDYWDGYNKDTLGQLLRGEISVVSLVPTGPDAPPEDPEVASEATAYFEEEVGKLEEKYDNIRIEELDEDIAKKGKAEAKKVITFLKDILKKVDDDSPLMNYEADKKKIRIQISGDKGEKLKYNKNSRRLSFSYLTNPKRLLKDIEEEVKP